MKQIVINVGILTTEVAILENGRVVEYFIERETEKKRIIGNIYKGQVANVLPGMESAFVTIGLEKNSFLYVKDLREFEEKYLDGIENSDKPIEDILNVRDEVIVQILKEPRGTKGARVTTHYTIPGKYLVLMPNSDYIAISKKISDESERERLNRLLEDIKPEGVGVIIRTAAKDKDEKDFEKEIEYLIKKWQEVENKIDKAKIGEVIYKDSNLIKRICRDAFSSDIDELIINSEEKHWELIDYISAFGDPELKTKVKLHRREEKIFDYYGVNEEIENALKKRVWLKCGGYLIIEKTEALISIDVNTGKNIGSSNLEETVFETNLEAAAEIPRQLRLRNLGGIIIIDFIDMNLEEDKDQVLEVLEENLSQDRIRSNIVRFSELGLVEMTRKRVGKELSTFFLESCKNCNGSGVVEAKEVIVYKIIKEIMNHADEEGVVKFEVNVHNDIKEILEDDYLLYIENYLQNCKKKVEFYTKNLYNRNEYKILLVEDED